MGLNNLIKSMGRLQGVLAVGNCGVKSLHTLSYDEVLQACVFDAAIGRNVSAKLDRPPAETLHHVLGLL